MESNSDVIINNTTEQVTMPSENHDDSHHHVQFAKKTEFIPVTIIEDHRKLHSSEESKNDIENIPSEVTISVSPPTVDSKEHVECSCRHSDDSDCEFSTKPRSILKHKPTCVVIVHQD